jgi:5-methylcytosine-specific restriction endonuclease McrA
MCRREERRKYKEKSPEKFREQKKRSRRNHKINHRRLPLLLYEWREWIFTNSPKFGKVYDREYFNTMSRKYYANNREKYIARVKEYNERTGYTQKHYLDNKDAIKARIKLYGKTPAGRVVKIRGRHRRRDAENKLECTLDLFQWEKILKNQQYCCNICKQPFTDDMPVTTDHIIPVCLGGGLTFENIQAVCNRCNMKKGMKLDKSNIRTWVHLSKQDNHATTLTPI